MITERTGWYFEPDTGAGSGGPPASPAPADGGAPSTPEPVAAPPSPGGSSASASPSAAPAAPAWLDSLRKEGFDYADEKAAFDGLKRLKAERDQMDGFRSYIPHLHDYLQNAKDYQAWRAEQAKKAAAPVPNAKKNVWDDYWQPPEYDPSWERRFLVRDANGNVSWDKNTPPDVIAKAQNYANWRQEQADKFLSNPHEFISKTVEGIATKIASDMIEQRFGQQKNLTDVSSFVQQHSGWIYELDQNGQPKQAQVFDPNTGQVRMAPVFSQWGQKFQEYVSQVHREQQKYGYTDDTQAANYALAMVQRDFAVAEAEKARATPAQPATPAAPPTTPQQDANKRFLDRANPPGKGGAQPRATGNVNPAEPKVNGRNIEKIMKQALVDGGWGNGIPK